MKRHFIALIVLFSCLMAKAQTPTQERRIYLVDVTASMEGRGAVETPDIFADVKNSLISTVSHIDDPRTEVIVIPFTNKPLDCYTGTIAKRDSLINDINGLSIRKGDTNIADAWKEGLTYIDSTRINYLFLLTDGLHNCGPTKDELYTRLSAWGEQSQGKYMFAFYVMLTENAKELEICKIVEATRNLWLIESMDIDASLIKTKTLMKTNVFDNHQASISFESNNPSLDLNSIGLNIALEDNPYYEIGDIEQSVMMHNTFRFSVIEKMAKKDIPIIDTIGLRIKHDSEKYPFVFFTPDYVDFVIANQGTRTVSISDRKLEGKELSCLDLKKLKYKEPFRGPFKWVRKYLEPTLSYPPFKWCKPDTTIIEFPLYISFNEESVRSGSSIGFLICDNDGRKVDYILSNTDSLITASEKGDTAMYKMTILPGSREKMIGGRIFASTSNVDKINGVDAAYGFDYFADWEAKYKQPWPIILWLVWILSAILILLIVGLILYFIFKAVIFLLLSPLFTSISAGAIQKAIFVLYGLPKGLFKLVYKVLPRKMQMFLKRNMPSIDNFKTGEVIPNNTQQKNTLEEMKRECGKTIKYKNGEIDFEPVAKYKVKLKGSLDKNIPTTLDPRSKVSYAQEKARDQMMNNKKGREIISQYVNKSPKDITIDDYTLWKDDTLNFGKTNHNPLTPHETIDGKYILWVPKKYHDVAWGGIAHSGGVSLLKSIRMYLS